MAQSAQTGNAEQGLGEIIVTATRREQTLQATPLAVTAISSEALTARGINGLGDIANGTVPGMQFAPFSGTPSILAISARGIGIADSTQGTQDLVVPLYIDGVPLGRAQGLGLELIDPERIEFLRGPQGQLFGRNAEGGAVQFVSRRPSGQFGFDTSGQVGNYGHDRERLRVDLPEFANLRLQGSIVHSQHDAYTKNEPKGVYSQQADYGYFDSFGFRIAAEWNPFDGFRANYAYDDSSIKDSQPYLVWTPVSILGVTPYSPMPAGTDDYPERVNSPTYNQFFRTKAHGHVLTLQYDLSNALTLKSITSYREASRHGSSTLGDALVAGASSTGIVRASGGREDVDQNQWYQEFQAIGSFNRLDLTIGGTYFREKVSDQRRSYVTGPGLNAPALGLTPAALSGCIGVEFCMTGRSEQHAKTDSYGVYAQGTYTPPILDDRLELTAGIRYSDDKKVAVRTYIQPLALPPYTETSPSGPLPPPALFRAKRWDPAFTVKYNFTDEVNAYVRYATAYRAGGVNVRSSDFSSYDEEEVESLEVGLKARMFDRRLSLNVAYYHQTVKGLQSVFQEQPTVNPALTTSVNLAQPLKVDGIEAEAVLRVADGLTLSAGYSFIDTARYQDYDNPLTAAVDITRFYAVQAPRHSGNIAADYETPDLGMGKLVLHLDYALSTGHWTTPGGLPVVSLAPDYSRPQTRTNMMNGRIALRDIPVGSMKGEVALFGKNILNSTAYTFGFDGAASGGGFGEFLPPPFSYGIELRIRY
ncbi:TonB-dependent receptor [Sphingobium sp. JS3065]|uniref:TonB-dependent receptor n=1 Tax=Sphingobium sp. JS3065 TaxID=2970925 RepID=UPI002264C654|nr:TonB-dependent receptor [Sphingobium sp. JS3065]UZW57386.1 TonB-dependent receptor [Sphingobium sp. JS3065]